MYKIMNQEKICEVNRDTKISDLELSNYIYDSNSMNNNYMDELRKKRNLGIVRRQGGDEQLNPLKNQQTNHSEIFDKINNSQIGSNYKYL